MEVYLPAFFFVSHDRTNVKPTDQPTNVTNKRTLGFIGKLHLHQREPSGYDGSRFPFLEKEEKAIFGENLENPNFMTT